MREANHINPDAFQLERWVCEACESGVPCVVEIRFSDDRLPDHLKGNQRFRNMVCLCNEGTPRWHQSSVKRKTSHG